MTAAGPSAETRLSGLLERLLNAAEEAIRSNELEAARSMAEEVRAVDADNRRAAGILDRISYRQLAPQGERVLVSLLFSDLVGSTMLSEQVEPERLRDVFSFYRATAREAVERYRGYVMQYSGDGILAGFGYPEPHEDDARRAVLAGLDLVAAMRAARSDLERRLPVAPRVRVGIHTGRVVVTDLRADTVRERDSIVGVTPNLAARIQSAGDPDQVVISDVTQQLVDADFHLTSLGLKELKGIGRSVEIFRVDAPRHAGARFEAERYRQTRLVGRDAFRDLLFGTWDGLAGGAASTRFFLVTGEAGIGKTRLVAELVQRVETSGGTVVAMSCLPYYSNVSLWPIARTIERILGVEEDDDRVEPLVRHLTEVELDLDRAVPLIAELLGVETDYPLPELEPSALREETLEVLVDWLAELASRTPLLFVAEDLHWADPSTIALLGRIVGRQASMLVVATTRDESVVPWRDEVEQIELSRLDESASFSLVDNLAAGRRLSNELRVSIVERAVGNPLYLEELTRSCLAEDRSDPIPLRLQELFTWRLKAPEVDLRVAQVAATVGPAFKVDTVAAVVEDPERVRRQVDVLLEKEIIESLDEGTGAYRFRHALMRDAAYETQVLDDRVRTHAGVAEAIIDQDGEPALIAEHLDRAGQVDRAVPRYLFAAQQEQAHGAHNEASRLLTRVLDLLAGLPESEERDLSELTARMLRGLSVSSMQGYAAPDVQYDHRRSEALAARLGERPEVLPSLIAIWAYWLTAGDLATARGLIDRLTVLVADPAFSWFEPEVAGCAGWLAFYEGEYRTARELLERALEGYAQRPSEAKVSPFWPLPNDPIAVSAIALACVHTVRGETDDARRRESEAIARAEAIGFPRGPFSLAFVKTYSAWMRRFLGDHAASRLLGAEVVGIGQIYGYAYWVMLGSSYVAAGQPDGAADADFLEQNIATLRMMGQEAFVASNLGHLASLQFEAGNIDRALELLGNALDVVRKTGEHVHLPELLRQRAVYSLARGGEAGEAKADLMEALRIADEQGARVAALRIATQMARLPGDVRPEDWRDRLQAARAAVPASLPEVDEADTFLHR